MFGGVSLSSPFFAKEVAASPSSSMAASALPGAHADGPMLRELLRQLLDLQNNPALLVSLSLSLSLSLSESMSVCVSVRWK